MQLTSLPILIQDRPNWLCYEQVLDNVYVYIKKIKNKLPLGVYDLYQVIIWDDKNKKILANYGEARTYQVAKDIYNEAKQVANLYS